MNHLSGVNRLANRYYAMRHGQSRANVAGVIVSGIENDRRGDWGLSELGREQALAAAAASGLPADTLICSSDFSRARQTAEIVRARLGAPPVVVAPALRERCFGDLEGTATSNYAQVWAADEARAVHTGPAARTVDTGTAADDEGAAVDGGTAADDEGTGGGDTGADDEGAAVDGGTAADDGTSGGDTGGGVEPAAAVLDRTTRLVADLERRYTRRDILLVSHGDTLQILQAGLLRMDPAAHRRLPPLGIAEIRALPLGEDYG